MKSFLHKERTSSQNAYKRCGTAAHLFNVRKCVFLCFDVRILATFLLSAGQTGCKLLCFLNAEPRHVLQDVFLYNTLVVWCPSALQFFVCIEGCLGGGVKALLLCEVVGIQGIARPLRSLAAFSEVPGACPKKHSLNLLHCRGV